MAIASTVKPELMVLMRIVSLCSFVIANAKINIFLPFVPKFYISSQKRAEYPKNLRRIECRNTFAEKFKRNNRI